MSTFYFRLENEAGAQWMLVYTGNHGPSEYLPYHKHYDNIELTAAQKKVYKDWLVLSATKRKKYFQKYSTLLESYCYSDDYNGPKLSINFSLEEPVLSEPLMPISCFDIPTVSLANLAPTPEIKSPGKKKGTTMYFEDDCDCCETSIVKRETFSPEKRYFFQRVDSVASELRQKAYVTYHMEPVAGPKTLNEFVQWVKDGKFTIKNNAGDKAVGGCGAAYSVYCQNNFSWGTETPDESGYEKACDAIRDAEQAAQDTIVAASDATAMKAAVDDLAAKTF